MSETEFSPYFFIFRVGVRYRGIQLSVFRVVLFKGVKYLIYVMFFEKTQKNSQHFAACRSISLYPVDFSVFLCYIFQDPKALEAMAQTTAEFLIEQGKAEGKQDAILKLLQLQFQNVPEVLSREIRNIHNLTRLDTLLEQAMTAQSL